MRKPYPMKIVDLDDERVSITEGLQIELAGKFVSEERARRLSEWLWAAADWIDTEKKVRAIPRKSKGGRPKLEQPH